jgi:hypothetical protein
MSRFVSGLVLGLVCGIMLAAGFVRSEILDLRNRIQVVEIQIEKLTTTKAAP